MSFSWKVATLASKMQRFLPAQAAATTAMEWLESHLATCVKPAAQEPPGVPKDAKSTEEITSPAGQPMSAFVFSDASTQAGGGGGGVNTQPGPNAVTTARLFRNTCQHQSTRAEEVRATTASGLSAE